MEMAIRELNNVIKYHENQRDEYFKFFNSDEFKNNTTGDNQIVIEHTRKIYDELIGELKQAIKILQQSTCTECEGRGYIEYKTGNVHDGYMEEVKEPCDCILKER